MPYTIVAHSGYHIAWCRYDVADVTQPRCGLPDRAGLFDVMSAHFVFESSANPDDASTWKDHVENATMALAPGGHLVMTTVLSAKGSVWEAGVWKDTVSLSEEDVVRDLTALGFADIDVTLIPGCTDIGYEAIAAITARSASATPAAIGSATVGTVASRSATTQSGSGSDDNGAVARFMKKHFKHFNSAALLDAAGG